MAQILHKEGAWYCRWLLHSFFDDCSHFQDKKGTHTGFTNDNKNDNFWHQKWSVKDTVFFSPFPLPFLSLSSPFPLPFLSLSSPFPLPFLSFSCLFLYSSFSFSFPCCCPFSFPCSFAFWFPFPFLFRLFSVPFLSFFIPFPFLFLSFSFPFPFPLPFLFCPFPSFTIPLPFPFPRSCEFFDQGVKPALGKTIRGKETITSGKPFERALVFYKPPYRYI